MPGTVMMAVTGVLARETPDRFPAASPIPAGILLYHALKHHWKIALVSEEPLQSDVEHWLRVQGLREHVYLLCGETSPPDLTLVERRQRQITMLRAMDASPDMLLDSSPSVVAMAMSMGLVGLLFGHPAYARPEFRPDAPRSVRQWDQIEAEVDAARTARLEREQQED